jgi:hypothetical protein
VGGIRANSAPPSSSALLQQAQLECSGQLECAGKRPLSVRRGWVCGAAGVPTGATLANQRLATVRPAVAY